jgi:hypothetical protein
LCVLDFLRRPTMRKISHRDRARRELQQRQVPRPPAPPKVPFAETRFAKWLTRPLTQSSIGACTLLSLAVLIFSNTNGNLTVWGDDIFMMSHIKMMSGWSYFHAAGSRGYLNPFYSFIYDINGQNTQRMHLFFFALLVVSSFLLFMVLRKVLGAAPAIVGAIFYLAYSGRYETITWMSAGAYLVAASVLFVSTWIALSGRLGPWTKGFLIAAINFVGVLLCEILIVVAPLYPLLYCLYRRLARKRIEWGALAATFLPLLMFAGHTTVIYVLTPKNVPLMWQRGGSRDGSVQLTAIARQLWDAFGNGLTAGLGREHISLVAQQVENFRKYAPLSDYAVVAAVAVCAGAVILLWSSPAVPFQKAVAVPLLVTGLYLALFSSLVGFTTNPGHMASRLLTLVGVGLALLAAAAVFLALALPTPAVRWVVLVAVLAVCGLEAAAMNSILFEYQTNWAYDSRIRTQLLSSGIKPEAGDTIFISLPERPIEGSWRTGSSHFEGGQIEALLMMDYGMVGITSQRPLVYRSEIRHRGWPPAHPAGRPGHELFCFMVSDGDFRLSRTDCAAGSIAPQR